MIPKVAVLRVVSVVFAMLLVASIAARADSLLFQTGNDGTSLYATNPTNGASTLIGNFGYGAVYGDAFAPDGTLYAMINSFSPSQLATVNLSTGAATPVGTPTGISDLMGIAFAPNGTLYGASWGSNDLYTLNLTTGQATEVGSLGTDGEVMDLAWDSMNSTMYGLSSYGSDGSVLYTVNLSTGAGTVVTNISGDSCLMGMAISGSGTFLATDYCSGNSPLYQINPSDGSLTSLGLTGISAPMGGDFQPTLTPEPPAVLLLGFGLLGLTGLAARKRLFDLS